MKNFSFRGLVRALLFGKEIEQTNKELRDSRTRFYTKQNDIVGRIEAQISGSKKCPLSKRLEEIMK